MLIFHLLRKGFPGLPDESVYVSLNLPQIFTETKENVFVIIAMGVSDCLIGQTFD